MRSVRLLTGPGAEVGGARLLLISYHFPPGAAVGGLRWLRFASVAKEFGWDLDVICADPAMLGRTDPGRLADLPPGTRVFGVRPSGSRPSNPEPPATRAPKPPTQGSSAIPSVIPVERLRWELYRPRGWLRLARAWSHLAEERRWANAAAGAAISIGSSNAPAAVISSGPPHLPHLAAVTAGRALGVPVVLDFRDPWSAMRAVLPDLATPLWPLLNRRYESRAVAGADLVIGNTVPSTTAMAEKYPGGKPAFITVMNGCDEELVPPPQSRERFVVAYAGNIYIDRNPAVLFRAAARVAAELGLRPEQFRIEFMGHADRLDGRTVEEIAAAAGISPYFTLHPVGPRAEAVGFLAGASVLVSLPQATPLSIPSKVFEYLSFEAWPLVLAAPGTATAAALEDSAVEVLAPDDEAGVAAFLRDRYLRFAAGERPGLVPGRERFSRRRQAELLFRSIRTLVPAGS